MKKMVYQLIGAAIVLTSIILLFVVADANKTISADYLEKYAKYPYTYPLEDATYSPNYTAGLQSALPSLALGILVVIGGEIVGILDGRKDSGNE